MPDKSIGIFRSLEANEGWFELDVSSVLERLLAMGHDILGNEPGNRVFLVDNPQPQTRALRVGRILVESVDDDNIYLVEPASPIEEPTQETADLTGQPVIDRSPKGEPGDWSVQALVFDKEFFTDETARQWIASRDEFDDFGNDESTGSYQFAQFDSKYFDMFKVVPVAQGVSAVHGQIVADENQAADDELVKAFDRFNTIRAMNRLIATKGLSLVQASQRVTVAKAEGGDTEERFILGIVLEPTIFIDGDGNEVSKPDTQDDVYTAQTVRTAAHGWMENYGLIDLMHNWEALSKNTVRVLETYIAPCDFSVKNGDGEYLVKEGTWLLALRVLNDELWTAIGGGDIGAYSIGGIANRQPLEDQPEA